MDGISSSCEALHENRALVRSLLLSLYDTLGIRNIRRAIDILETRWSVSVTGARKSLFPNSLRIGRLADLNPESDCALMDFIPY